MLIIIWGTFMRMVLVWIKILEQLLITLQKLWSLVLLQIEKLCISLGIIIIVGQELLRMFKKRLGFM